MKLSTTSRYPVIFLILLGFCTYSISLSHGFLWDDEILILQNPLIRSFSWVGNIFASGFWSGEGDYYRPLAIFTYLLDHTINGLNPFGYHLSNLIYHLLSVLGLYSLMKIHFENHIAFWVAALFSIHPIGAATVFPVFGRCGILEGILFWGLVFFTHSGESFKKRVLVVITFLLGLLSKESSLIFPTILSVYEWRLLSPTHHRSKNRISLIFVLWTLSAVYIGARLYWHPFKTKTTLSLIAEASLSERIWTFFESLLHYFEIIFFPLKLHTERHFVSKVAAPWEAPLPWIGILIFLGMLSYGWKNRIKQPHFLFGTLWFLIWLAPTSNLIPLPMTIAEHWLYMPIGGILWIIADLTQKRLNYLRSNQQVLLMYFLMTVLVFFYSIRTIFRGFDWKDPMRLYSHDLEYSPNSFLLHNNYGTILFREGKFDIAKQEFLAAIQINSHYGMAWNNLGAVYQRQGNAEKAIESYRLAIKFSGDSLAYENLAGILLLISKPREAQEILQLGLQFHPHSVNLLRMTGQDESSSTGN